MWRSRRPTWCRPIRSCKSIADVDQPGIRIAVTARAAYDLWLDRNIKHATLVRSNTLDSAYEQFVADKLDALAGLKPRLISDVTKTAGCDDPRRPIHRRAAGGRHPREANSEGAAFLRNFVEEAKASGLVASLIAETSRGRPVGGATRRLGRMIPPPLGKASRRIA